MDYPVSEFDSTFEQLLIDDSSFFDALWASDDDTFNCWVSSIEDILLSDDSFLDALWQETEQEPNPLSWGGTGHNGS